MIGRKLKFLILLTGLSFSSYVGFALQPFRNLKVGKTTKNATLQANVADRLIPTGSCQ